jgi:hypothetical protein
MVRAALGASRACLVVQAHDAWMVTSDADDNADGAPLRGFRH